MIVWLIVILPIDLFWDEGSICYGSVCASVDLSDSTNHLYDSTKLCVDLYGLNEIGGSIKSCLDN